MKKASLVAVGTAIVAAGNSRFGVVNDNAGAKLGAIQIILLRLCLPAVRIRQATARHDYIFNSTLETSFP